MTFKEFWILLMWNMIGPGRTNLFPRECWHRRNSTWSLFSSQQTGLCSKNCPCLDHWQNGDQIGQAGNKQNDCQNMPRQVRQFWNFSASENGLSDAVGLSQIWMPEHCKWDFAWFLRWTVVSVYFLYLLEVAWLHFLLTQVILFSFSCLWLCWRLDSHSYLSLMT